jgi:hypothetical protein
MPKQDITIESGYGNLTIEDGRLMCNLTTLDSPIRIALENLSFEVDVTNRMWPAGCKCWFRLINKDACTWYDPPMPHDTWRTGTFLTWGTYRTDHGTEGNTAVIEDIETGQTVSVLATCLRWKAPAEGEGKKGEDEVVYPGFG